MPLLAQLLRHIVSPLVRLFALWHVADENKQINNERTNAELMKQINEREALKAEVEALREAEKSKPKGDWNDLYR